jgi:hypothetical protein
VNQQGRGGGYYFSDILGLMNFYCRGADLPSNMGRDSSSAITGKRSRVVEDEIYYDNYHVHKRYLTEVMASSLNGLKVGESESCTQRASPPLPENMVSPAQTEAGALSRSASSFPSHGDELSTLDSPMSEDSDDSVGYRMGVASELSPYMPVSCTEATSSHVSIRRSQRPSYSTSSYSSEMAPWQQTPPPYTPSLPLPCSSQSRVKIPDGEGRLPPSPNDPTQSADLRRAALMRSVQIRAQSPVIPGSSVVTSDKSSGKEGEGLEEGGDQSSPNPPEQTGCSSDDLARASQTLFPSGGTRTSNHVLSLLLDDTIAVATSLPSISQEQEVEKVSRPSRFEEENSHQKNARGYSKHVRAPSRDGSSSDTESSLSWRPSSPVCKKSCKKLKPF